MHPRTAFLSHTCVCIPVYVFACNFRSEIRWIALKTVQQRFGIDSSLSLGVLKPQPKMPAGKQSRASSFLFFSVCFPSQATLWFAQAYYSKPAQDSDILAVARMTSFIKQARISADAADMKHWQNVPRMIWVGACTAACSLCDEWAGGKAKRIYSRTANRVLCGGSYSRNDFRKKTISSET